MSRNNATQPFSMRREAVLFASFTLGVQQSLADALRQAQPDLLLM